MIPLKRRSKVSEGNEDLDIDFSYWRQMRINLKLMCHTYGSKSFVRILEICATKVGPEEARVPRVEKLVWTLHG